MDLWFPLSHFQSLLYDVIRSYHANLQSVLLTVKSLQFLVPLPVDRDVMNWTTGAVSGNGTVIMVVIVAWSIQGLVYNPSAISSSDVVMMEVCVTLDVVGAKPDGLLRHCTEDRTLRQSLAPMVTAAWVTKTSTVLNLTDILVFATLT